MGADKNDDQRLRSTKIPSTHIMAETINFNGGCLTCLVLFFCAPSDRARPTKAPTLPPITTPGALLEWGLTLKSSLGAITYLDYCSMPNGKGLHIVFKRNDSQ
ncbi:DUF3379 domain-containing protein, partial [Ketobacter nezhaii]|uniref:DUF3379 domain-containing protein n=1 Tax=Ketobacter sp. MCCC 1A13808 TaxID=2602738 RepID=UPI001E55724B